MYEIILFQSSSKGSQKNRFFYYAEYDHDNASICPLFNSTDFTSVLNCIWLSNSCTLMIPSAICLRISPPLCKAINTIRKPSVFKTVIAFRLRPFQGDSRYQFQESIILLQQTECLSSFLP
jgi:hypothetical protein